jgi:23S rRNA (guanosine2251-2'-O)-methyltransferase
VLVERTDESPETAALRGLAAEHGVAIWSGSEGDLRRMLRGDQPERVLAMVGPDPRADLETALGWRGAIWLLHDAAYPSNAGFAIRTAEVAGADAIVIDARFNHDDKSRALHVCMGAHRMLPVLWETTARVLDRARAHGYRIFALEDVGARAPAEVDLTGPVVLVIGGERDGIPDSVLRACDAVIRVPMAGFVPSYNLQAAMSMVAYERLRQLEGSDRVPRE